MRQECEGVVPCAMAPYQDTNLTFFQYSDTWFTYLRVIFTELDGKHLLSSDLTGIWCYRHLALQMKVELLWRPLRGISKLGLELGIPTPVIASCGRFVCFLVEWGFSCWKVAFNLNARWFSNINCVESLGIKMRDVILWMFVEFSRLRPTDSSVTAGRNGR